MKRILLFLIVSVVTSSFIPDVSGKDSPNSTSGWKKYKNKDMGFSIEYPQGYTVNDSYVYTFLGEGKEIHGVSFTIPESFARGTNLSGETYISVERISSNGGCYANNFLYGEARDSTAIENGITYNIENSSDAATGNYYEETVYATSSGGYCYAIRLFIHSTQILNYDPGTVKEFDRNKLVDIYNKMRSTLRFY